MTKALSVTTGAIAAVVSILLFAGVQTASASSTLFDDASVVGDGNPGNAVQIRSDVAVSPGYGGVRFNDASGLLFPALTTLSTDFNVTNDSCGGGSPRIQIQIDTNGDSISNGNVFVYMGPSPSFAGCTTGWQSTGNLIGNTDAGRWDFTQLGGPLGTYASAPANVIAGTILNISVVADGSWSAAATGGDSEQTILIDNVVINTTTYDFTPLPVTVTINKFIDGAQATAGSANSSAFPMSATWNTTNIGAGTGAYDLDADGFNGNPTPYQAITSSMSSGADYSTYEVTSGAVVGASCADGKPYALVGYSSGNTPTEAASTTPSLTVPSFTGLTSDKYVIVWNTICVPMPVHLSPANGSTLTSAALTSIDWTDVVDPAMPMTYRYQASNSSAINPDGSFVSPVYTSGVLAVSMIPTPGTPAGVYYWHVRAVDNDGNMSPWTSAWQVTVDNTPPTPPAPPADACTLTQAPAGYTLQNGTSGSDTVTLAPFTMFKGNGGNDKVTAPDGNYIICTGSGNDTITIGNGDYTIDAGKGNNTITTGNGAGPITTGSGNDTITTGNGAHTINAGKGNNTITTGDGVQSITTGSGNDKITTGSGSDTISAGNGNNTVTANGGDDTITAGSGNDIVDGGSGTDTCNAGSGSNTVTNCP